MQKKKKQLGWLSKELCWVNKANPKSILRDSIIYHLLNNNLQDGEQIESCQ